MNDMTLEERREERFFDITSDMDAEELAQYAIDFIFSDDELKRKFVGEFLADFDDEDDFDEDEEEEYEE